MKMKAIVYYEYGAPEVLEIKEMEKPTPKDREVLIRVFATTVNRTDCAMLRAKPFIMRFFTGLSKPNNPILGTDFAGTIEAIGKDVKSFKVGDKVFGFNDRGVSSHAEYMTLSEDDAIAIMPHNVSYPEAAASLEGSHYAYNFFNKINIQSGQRVLVNGATGAIGSSAVQFLKYFGADVTAVCSSQNMELVKSLGASKVFDYTKEDFTASNEKFHFIFDTVGKSSFAACKPLLYSGGIYISSELGWMAQNIFFALIKPFIGDKKVIFPIPSDCKRSVLFIKKLFEEGKFQAVVDRKYPMEEIAEAYKYVESGQKIGNVIITRKKSVYE
jgi:NADPH:quinone reductase-like Zn-dependent oxidoreductase